MYGLMKEGIIVHKALKEHLKPYSRAPAKITQEIWTHQDRYINFTLVIDVLESGTEIKRTLTTLYQQYKQNMR